MVEDKLTRDERIRLEALAQAVVKNGIRSTQASAEAIISDARKFEEYIGGRKAETGG